MKKLLLILLTPLLLFSCKKKVYHSFTDEERAFLMYSQGDIFKMKNEGTGEITTFAVNNKIIEFKEDFGPKLGSSNKEHYMEEGFMEFECISNCLTANNEPDKYRGGNIYIYKDKIDQFILSINFTYDKNKFGDSGGGEYQLISTSANGIDYNNLYGFTREDGVINCYLSKELGFVKLENPDENLTYVRVP